MLNLPLRQARHHRAALQHRSQPSGEIRRGRAELVRLHQSSTAAPASSRSKMRRNTGASVCPRRPQPWHDAPPRPHASAPALQGQRRPSGQRLPTSSRLADPPRRRADARRSASPPTPSCASRPTAAAASWCGSTRRCPPTPDAGVVRLDRFVRQALKAHLNETVEIEKADLGGASASSSTRRSTSRWRMTSCRISRRCMVREPHAGQHRRGALCRPSRIRMPARPTRSSTSPDGPGIVDETTPRSSLHYPRRAPAGRRVRRHLRGRRRAQQADQADPRAGAASAQVSRTSIAISASIRRAGSSSTARRAPEKPISRAPSPTRSTRASTTSTAPT